MNAFEGRHDGIKFLIVFWLGLVLVGPYSCAQSKDSSARSYLEITSIWHPGDASLGSNANELESSWVQDLLTWRTPSTWHKTHGTSGFDMVTFVLKDQERRGHLLRVSLTSFPGEVGGLGENVIRWLGQVGLRLDKEALGLFIGSMEERSNPGGLHYVLVDSRSLKQDRTHEESYDVGVATFHLGEQDRTVFVKIMGPSGLVNREWTSFMSLCGSIRLNKSAATEP